MTRRLGLLFVFAALLFEGPAGMGRGLSLKPGGPGSLHIIAIGISRYEVPNGLALAYCTLDAVAFANSLQQVADSTFTSVKKHLLIDAQATFAGVQKGIDSVIAAARPEDTFVFYFAGFSTVNRKSGELYLVTSNATSLDDDARLEAEAISGLALKVWFTKVQARNQLIVLDAGPSTFETLRTYYDQESRSLQNLLGQNLMMLTVQPYSFEINRFQHGIFTQSLLEGLSGRAANPLTTSGSITAWGLESFVSRSLFEYADVEQRKNFRADRYIRGNDFPLGRAPRSARDTSTGRSPRRGVTLEEEPPPPPPVSAVKTGPKKYALVFATDVYDNWASLTNPSFDASTISAVLKEDYGFKTELVLDAPRDTILTRLLDYSEKTYNDNDELFVFFAGHGDFNEVVNQGYIVARDSKAKKDDRLRNTYLSHSQLRDVIDNIPCKHIFLVLDVCFGGTFDQRITKGGHRGDDEYDEVSREKYIERKMKLKTRMYLTSGGKEYVPDGREKQHSPFARKFIEALRSYGGKDRTLTLGKIKGYVEKIEPEPRAGEFGANEPGSDFIFVLPPDK